MTGLDVARLLEAELVHVALVAGTHRFEEMAHVVAEVEAAEHADDEHGAHPFEDGDALWPLA
jgi:hypothetical protein